MRRFAIMASAILATACSDHLDRADETAKDRKDLAVLEKNVDAPGDIWQPSAQAKAASSALREQSFEADSGNYCAGTWEAFSSERPNIPAFQVRVFPETKEGHFVEVSAPDKPPVRVPYLWGNVEAAIDFQIFNVGWGLQNCNKTKGTANGDIYIEGEGYKEFELKLVR